MGNSDERKLLHAFECFPEQENNDHMSDNNVQEHSVSYDSDSVDDTDTIPTNNVDNCEQETLQERSEGNVLADQPKKKQSLSISSESAVYNVANDTSSPTTTQRCESVTVSHTSSSNDMQLTETESHGSWFYRHIGSRIDGISLSIKLVACTFVVLTAAALCISLSIRQLVGNYLLEKTDMQLADQAQLIYDNIDALRNRDGVQATVGPNDYFLQIRDSHNKIIATPLVPQLKGNIISMPVLPADGSIGNRTTSKPFTTPALISGDTNKVDSNVLKTASAPWRVLILNWSQRSTVGKPAMRGLVYIALPLSDQVDTVNTLTAYALMVSVAVTLLGVAVATIIIQSTLVPLKRIEKVASKIASGDLSRRVPSQSSKTEVGSLAASLNSMLSRIERSFNEQEAMNEKMKRFISDASHELRTPLAAIHGYAELYSMWRSAGNNQEQEDEAVARIKASSERMTELVEDLLSLARFDEGRGMNISHTVDLSEILTDAMNDLHALDPQRCVRVGSLSLVEHTDGSTVMQDDQLLNARTLEFIPGTLPNLELFGDAARLRQVMTNIIGNIHRYTPKNSPVEIGIATFKSAMLPEYTMKMESLYSSLQEFLQSIDIYNEHNVVTDYAVIRVIDHGPGVPEESLSRIFERFYIADPSRDRKKGGTGLGMAIVQSVVKAHHGCICPSISEPINTARLSNWQGWDGEEMLDPSRKHGLTLTIILPISKK